MGQVTIYLDEATEKKMRAAAQAQNLSKSKFIARLISKQIADQWPASVAQLAGAWRDMPQAEEIRSGLASDVTREDF